MNFKSLTLSNEARFKLAVHTALLAGLSTAAGTATAQTTGAPAAPGTTGEKATELETLQVTGSRLPAPGLIAVSPVTTITSEEITYMGVTRIEDLINQMPQVFAGQGAYLANGATGTATVDLRNLGPARTLVLIDGKRLMPGDPRITSAAADLNNIPTSMVDRVDILTGGASAVYGSDALAGVVNFIMKRDFEGVRVDYQHSFYQHNNDDGDMPSDAVRRRVAGGASAAQFRLPESNVTDGERNLLSLTMGMNSADGRGNATMYATYQGTNAVDQGQRTYSACALGRDVANQRYTCSGSSTSATGRFANLAGLGAVPGPFNYTVVPSGTPGVGAFRTFSSADLFNFNPYNYYQRNNERWGLGVFAHYGVNEVFDVYTDIMYMDDRTNGVIAPSGAFVVPVSTECSNPLIGTIDPDAGGPLRDQYSAIGCTAPTDVINFYVLRRNVEGGGRDDDLRHTAIRGILGTKGELIEGVRYDLYGQYGETLLSEIYRNDFSIVRTTRALDVVDGGGGTPVCRSVLDGTDPNCVPWNIWAPGGVNQSQLNYLQTPGFLHGTVKELVVHNDFSSDLGRFGLRLPSASEGVSALVGTEYRREETVFESDSAFSTGDLAGQGGATIGTQGAYQVSEFFTEFRVPFVEDMPGIHSLSSELGYRFSSYSRAGTSDTWKLALAYAPIKDVSLRIANNRAVRAPNVIELSSPLSVSLDGNTDPCSGTAVGGRGPDNILGTADDPAPTGGPNDLALGGATRAQCANDPVIGASPGLFGTIAANPAEQYNGLQGSSPGLAPETADSLTVGLVFTPTFVRDVAITFDYFDIDIEGLIAQIGADTILEECYTRGNLCSAINREPASGSLWLTPAGFVTDPITNTGSLRTRGFDLGATYALKLPEIGELDFELVGTHIVDFDQQPVPGGVTFGCDGLYGLQCGTPTPRWRHKFRTTWSVPAVDVSLQWRYLSEVEADNNSLTIRNDKTLDAYNYFDLAFGVPFGQYKLSGGINNILDDDPPAINQSALPSVFGSGNTFPQVYDPLGRYVFLGVKLDF